MGLIFPEQLAAPPKFKHILCGYFVWGLNLLLYIVTIDGPT